MLGGTAYNVALSPRDCGHGSYNTTTGGCDCDPGWSTDVNQDALSGNLTFCGVQGSTIAPTTPTPGASAATPASTMIIICACAVAGVLLVALILGCICCRRRRRARRRKEQNRAEEARTQTIMAMLTRVAPVTSRSASAEETANVVTRVLQSSGLLPPGGTAAYVVPSAQATSRLRSKAYYMRAQPEQLGWGSAGYGVGPAYVDAPVATYVNHAPAQSHVRGRRRRPLRIPSLNPAALDQVATWVPAGSTLPYGGGVNHEPYGNNYEGMLDEACDLDYVDDRVFEPDAYNDGGAADTFLDYDYRYDGGNEVNEQYHEQYYDEDNDRYARDDVGGP